MALELTSVGEAPVLHQPIRLPTDPAGLGTTLYIQALVADPGVNPAGLVATEAGFVQLGG